MLLVLQQKKEEQKETSQRRTRQRRQRTMAKSIRVVGPMSCRTLAHRSSGYLTSWQNESAGKR